MVVGEKCWSVLFSVNRYMSVWISGRCSTPSRISRRAARVQWPRAARIRSEEHTSELQSQSNLVCRLLLEKKNNALSDLAEGLLPIPEVSIVRPEHVDGYAADQRPHADSFSPIPDREHEPNHVSLQTHLRA